MPLLLVGINHKTAPLEIRERFALSSEQGQEMLRRLVPYVPHAAVLATCNRTEIYATVHNTQVGVQHLQRFLADWTGIPMGELGSYLYSHLHWAALRHLFRVAAGLDSMILGEEQILGQLRDAMEQAKEQQSLDAALSEALLQALRTGRQVRSETAISRNAVSVSSVAVGLAREHLGSLDSLQALVISAGEAGKLATRSLAGQGVQRLWVTNRSPQRAQELAQRMGGQAISFDDLDGALETADFVITATGASTHLLTRNRMTPILERRLGRPLLLVDIAVPRDVEPSVAQLPGVVLFNLDDVQRFAVRNLKLREQEVVGAERLIEASLARFQRWWRTREVVPTIAALTARGEDVRAAEAQKTLQRLSHLAPEDRERLEAMSRAIVKKLLHEPLMYLKERRDGESSIELVQALFGLSAPEHDTLGEDPHPHPPGALA
ncbi:MAG: glutamyl-tRNA reductase [Chloroflexi bacterium]|nr:glutamyl-tRNA reductase [Chloroflexota bacterium]